MFNLFKFNKCHKNIFINVFSINCCPLPNTLIILKNKTTNKILKSFTNRCGCACFKNIPCSSYEVIIYKKKYKPLISSINTFKNYKFQFKIRKFKNSVIKGLITNSSNNRVIEATVVLYLVIGKNLYTPVQFTKSNDVGFYTFKNVPVGKYIIKAIK